MHDISLMFGKAGIDLCMPVYNHRVTLRHPRSTFGDLQYSACRLSFVATKSVFQIFETTFDGSIPQLYNTLVYYNPPPQTTSSREGITVAAVCIMQ
ncbi:hypothetical protein BABINDRAFT_163510 [Babjeviella inositovora NRRL Y-12698]|uniref:Uncharacterized protein n=1 Tax=Babjeviella inositovora NRRL Y-12698 TaxID=984486 RepID=A0A1E3QIH7_9ASCO|nr:uncharacterized protein BABINDRAFT_163510 [Babjeviella inositovora NRRL Y-12698]ODQ77501.1 hypothetical protein BABINDRAFT_163510 [Babjeviella inositovora NRRL Y-12698]